MKMIGALKIIIVGLIFLFSCPLFSQYPNYFTYNDENGLPSNEVYSLVQDQKGFIWIGCETGLYKFDGVRYINYKCATQKSKAVTGLTLGAEGNIYCYNFQGQLFVLDNDKLEEIVHGNYKINCITTDQSGNLLASHHEGISHYNEKSKEWNDNLKQKKFVRISSLSNQQTSWFLYAEGIGKVENEKISFYKNNLFKDKGFGTFHIESFNNNCWIISAENNLNFHFYDGKIKWVNHPELTEILRDRKITRVRKLSDGNLWICTYEGIVRFNPNDGTIKLFYPELSFSDCLIDVENNFWMSTLQSGIIRVPDMNFLVWNSTNDLLRTDKLTKITTDGTNIYFSTISGNIGKLNTENNQLDIFTTNKKGDIQSLNYNDNQLCFNLNNEFYTLQNNRLSKQVAPALALKTILTYKNTIFYGSSHGLFIGEKGEKPTKNFTSWIREIIAKKSTDEIWVASNSGIFIFQNNERKWKLVRSVLSGIQILSLKNDEKEENSYALAFDGTIYKISQENQSIEIAHLPKEVEANTLQYYENRLFFSSNKGLWILDLATGKWEVINKLSGLASNNIRGFVIVNGAIWAATGKGLQKIPLNHSNEYPKATIYAKETTIMGERSSKMKGIQLNYGQSLTIIPEVSNYRSNGNFQYAYRIKNLNQDWNLLPSSVNNILVPNIPSGNFVVELKAIDHQGRDSANTLIFSGYVKPPFWVTWWFTILIILVSLFLFYLIFRAIVRNIRKKALLQTELSNSKLVAIQAQMNPHFIFNSLNSIQDLVLKGELEYSYSYLSTFSDLVRKTLNYSDKDYILFEQEIKLLNLYLSLEKLRFKDTLEYTIDTNEIEDIQIPPMLIQPFVENALLHGLLHKEGLRKLTICFELKNHLICTITDNGIGREQAKRIRERQKMEHNSFSGTAIQKRFELLSESLHRPFGFNYTDLEENGVIIGTKVTLEIPIKRLF